MSEVVSIGVGEIGEDVWARPVGRGGLPGASGAPAAPNVKRDSDRDVYLWELSVGMMVVPRYGTPYRVTRVERRNGLVRVHADNGDCAIFNPATELVTVRGGS